MFASNLELFYVYLLFVTITVYNNMTLVILLYTVIVDLQAFLVFSQNPAGVYCAGKPLESVVYCLIRVQWLSVVHKMRRFYCFSEVLEESLDVNG